jgi:CheY-like chemotaxis protein
MSASLPGGQSARRASILVVDDEPDFADLCRQCFRREVRQGTYVMQFAARWMPYVRDRVCRRLGIAESQAY